MKSKMGLKSYLVISAVFAMVGCALKDSDPRSSAILVAHWSMDDTLGRTLADESGNGHEGRLIGRPEFLEGVSGNALMVAGNGHGIDVADDSAFEFRGSFSIRLSFKISAWPPGQGFLIFRGDGRSGLDPYQLAVDAPDSTLRFTIIGNPTGSTGDSSVSISAPVRENQWYRVDAVFDTTGGNSLALYLNGALVKEKTTSIFPLAELQADQNPGIGIGHHPGRISNDYAFRGLIDEVKVFSGALSDAEIASGRP